MVIAMVIAPDARSAVLYDQSTGVSPQSTPAQEYEPATSSFDTEIADDFVVPAGKAWRIEEVFARGIRGGDTDATSFRVSIYSNSSNLPGSTLINNVLPITSGTYPRPEIVIPAEPVLQTGTFWLGLKAILDRGPDLTPDQWFWSDNPTAFGNTAVIKNPGNGFGSDCTTFTPRLSCSLNGGPPNSSPDQMFRLSGTEFSATPETTIDSGPAAGSTVTTTSATFGFSSTEPESSFSCSIDGGSFAPCTSPNTVSGLSDGSHTFSVRVTNGLGTVDPTPASRGFKVDTGPGAACVGARAGLKKAQTKLRKATKQARKARTQKAKKSAARKVKSAKAGVSKARKRVTANC